MNPGPFTASVPSSPIRRRVWGPALCLALAALAGCSGAKMDCARLDPALTYCPAPPAPRGKDLTGGKVVVQVAVLPNGTVAEARVLSSSGHPVWADTVLRTVKRWRFKPQEREVTKVIPFRFKLGGKAAAESDASSKPSGT